MDGANYYVLLYAHIVLLSGISVPSLNSQGIESIFLGHKKTTQKYFLFLALPNRMRVGWFEVQKCSIDDKSKFVSNKRIGRFNINFKVWPPAWMKSSFCFPWRLQKRRNLHITWCLLRKHFVAFSEYINFNNQGVANWNPYKMTYTNFGVGIDQNLSLTQKWSAVKKLLWEGKCLTLLRCPKIGCFLPNLCASQISSLS